MADVADPDTLLEWLNSGKDEERDMQLIALEQLCMLLLMSDNVDRCFEICSPRSFLPALCKIFLDEKAPDNVLEVTARAITYYLDVSADCTKKIDNNTIKAICKKLILNDPKSRTALDLAEQNIKVLEHICLRESGAIFEAGGLNSVFKFIKENGYRVHKDTLHSAMNVVSRLCQKIEPNDSSIDNCVQSLSNLLKHEDSNISDGALRCFAALADKFTRRGVDAEPLAKQDLISQLLNRLNSINLNSYHQNNHLSPNLSSQSSNLNKTNARLAYPVGNETKTAQSISTVISLLLTLCRGSPACTAALLNLKESLIEAISSALNGDERCALDMIRLVDLLILLIFEGRSALPKSTISSSNSNSKINSFRRMSVGESTHRQLIECIRSKDTDALIQSIVLGNIEANFTDDVGQTLLNWAASFGTQEMVEFLLEQGADVNKGQRSSSLHYAACFGRPNIVKILLRNGANVDLRDDDGKTALDKGERNDEGHREVVNLLLQSPSEWMSDSESSSNSKDKKKKKFNKSPLKQQQQSQTTSSIPNSDSTINTQEIDPTIIAYNEPQLVNDYINKLLPIFCNTFQSSMIRQVKKSSLNIIRKIVYYMNREQLVELDSKSSLTCSKIVEVISSCLDSEEDEDCCLYALQMIQDLMDKEFNLFLDHFQRLGVFNKVQSISGLNELNNNIEIDSNVMITINKSIYSNKDEDDNQLNEQQEAQEECKEIQIGKPYHWRDWNIVRSKECLYLWSDSVILELSNGSNGWFRFILDNKLQTMYSSGAPENGSESTEDRNELFEKLHRAKSQIRSSTNSSQCIISSTNPTTSHTIGNWNLKGCKDNELIINNIEGVSQSTILKEDLNGFLFESNRGTKHTFVSEIPLSSEFNAGWPRKGGKKFKSKTDILRQKLRTLAKQIYEYVSINAQHQPRSTVAKLNSIIASIDQSFSMQSKNDPNWRDGLQNALKDLLQLLNVEHSISSYELYTSGLIPSLIKLLKSDTKTNKYTYDLNNDELTNERIDIFKQVFNSSTVSKSLVKKLISVLESIEKLPVYYYETPCSSSYSLQILTKKLRFKLERSKGQNSLIDRTGRCMKSEPLTTVGQLEKFLLRMVAKQWYDYDRSTFNFVKKFKDKNTKLEFNYKFDFDENGILYWLGTNGKKTNEWVNPQSANLVYITSNENLLYGRLRDILSRDINPLNCHTNDNKKSQFTIDLGLYVIPTAYTLRHSRGYEKSALRNWKFEVSRDNDQWLTLYNHVNDQSLNEAGSTATWKINYSNVSLQQQQNNQGWRYVRIQQTGKNSSGQYYYMSISGFELYGTVLGVCETLCKTSKEVESNLRKQRKIIKSQLKHIVLGAKVVRGPDYKWFNQDGGQDSEGTISSQIQNGWVDCIWSSNGSSNSYRMGAENRYDLKLSPNYNPEAASNLNKSTLKSLPNLENSNQQLPVSQNIDLTTTDNKSNLSGSIHSNRKSSSTSSLFDNSNHDNTKLSKLSSDLAKQTSSEDNLKKMQSNSTGQATLVRTKGDISLSEITTDRDYSFSYNLQCLSPTKEENEDNQENDSYQSNKFKLSKNDSMLKENNTTATFTKSINDNKLSNKTDLKNELDVIASSNSNKITELLNNNLACTINNNLKIDNNNEIDRLDRNSMTDHSLEIENSSNNTNNTNLMSVSVPNLSLNHIASLADETSSKNSNINSNNLMEAFNSLSRKSSSSSSSSSNNQNEQNSQNNQNNNLNNSNSAFNNDQLCSLVRLALASNFPEIIAELIGELANTENCTDILQNQLLSTAQSYPSLSKNDNQTTITLTDARRNFLLPQSSSFNLPTSSDSELFENCTTSLLSGIEDELDVNDENEDELEDENEEYDYVNLIDESNYDLNKNKRKMGWDDDFVLKRHYPELIASFDPRPGRTNMNQTVDLEIQEPSTISNLIKKRKESRISLTNNSTSSKTNLSPKIMLSFKLTSTYTNKEYELDLVNPNWTVFSAAQYLTQQVSNSNKQELKLRRVWDSIITINYREIKEDELDNLDRQIPIYKSSIRTLNLSTNEVEEILNVNDNSNDQNFKLLNDVLILLKLIYHQILQTNEQMINKSLSDLDNNLDFDSIKEDFISKKITNKLMQQIQDPLVLTSACYPEWCDRLITNYPMIFPFEIRSIYFQSTSFGTARSIVWVQNQRDLIQERSLGPSPRRDHEFRLGRLLHERVCIPRGTNLLNWSMEVLRVTATKKSILEIEFKDESGTGSGPSLEFYALVAAEIQRKDLKMWLCDDAFIMINDSPVVDCSQNPDYYVNYSAGLFPCPYNQSHKNINEICQLFEFLGVFIAKALLDNRLVDLPLSLSFLKIFSHYSLKSNRSIIDDELANLNTLIDKIKKPLSKEEELIRPRGLIEKEVKSKIENHMMKEKSWLKGILNEYDYQQLFPNQGKFLNQLKELSNLKQKILLNPNLSLDEKQNEINNLYIPMNADNQIRLEDLGLVFQYLPTSKIYEYEVVDLKVNGEFEEVNMSNFEEYYELLLDFCLNIGIKKQIEAFKNGFNKVFPIERLSAFSPEEIRLMLCGDQCPRWTKDDIIAYTEPKLGFTKESTGFKKFVNVLDSMNAKERKAFLQFATGCSTLPIGGLANLHPRLTIVKKVDADDYSYPSVNTCAHYLKLPDYSSEKILKERLLAATIEKGFHLN